MTEVDRIKRIRGILKSTFPNVKTQLDHSNPFELLIATILSAQCTDKQVNVVSRELFAKLPTAADIATAPIQLIESIIRPTGYYRNKARNIQDCSKALVKDFNGVVPDSLDLLTKLPGVGRKTANVVLGGAFGIPGIVVDTHVSRISQRLGLTPHKDAVKIEFDLMDVIPREEWNDFSLQLIYLGRSLCTAKKPNCPACPLYDDCMYPDKRHG